MRWRRTPCCARPSAPISRGEFLRLKRMEWVEYMRHVSDWEVERYLEFF